MIITKYCKVIGCNLSIDLVYLFEFKLFGKMVLDFNERNMLRSNDTYKKKCCTRATFYSFCALKFDTLTFPEIN